MRYIAAALAVLELLWLCTSLGSIVSRILKKEYGVLECLSEGFIWILGIFSFMALPFLWFGGKFHILFWIFILFSFIAIICGSYIFMKDKIAKQNRILGHKDVLLLSAIILIAVQMVCSTYLYHEDDDDGYYIAISNIAVEQDTVQTDSRMVYDGKLREEIGTGFQPPIIS